MSSKQRSSKHSYPNEPRPTQPRQWPTRNSDDNGLHYKIRGERDEYEQQPSEQAWPQQNQYYATNAASYNHATRVTQYFQEESGGRYHIDHNTFQKPAIPRDEETSEHDYSLTEGTQWHEHAPHATFETSNFNFSSISQAHRSWGASQASQLLPSIDTASPWTSATTEMLQWPPADIDEPEDLQGSQYTIRSEESAMKMRKPVKDRGTFLGVDCESMGVLRESYWKDPQKYKTPGSYWNPRRLKKNCLFVSVGYLLGVTAEDISSRLDRKTLSTVSAGPSIGEVEQILKMIGGMRIKSFVPGGEASYREKLETQQAFAMRKLKKWVQKYGNGPFALAYRRMDGSGHVVVARKTNSRSGGGRLADYNFVCYQKLSDGEDKFKDVKQSCISFAVFAVDQPGGLEMDFYEEPLDDITHRTRFYIESGASGEAEVRYDTKPQRV